MSLQQLVSLREKQHDLQSAWYRQILTIASGGLAILAGLGPDAPAGIGKYFLAGTWLFLGIGIVAGGVATYLEVDRAKNLARDFQAQMRKTLEVDGRLAMTELVVANPNKIFSWSKPLMVVSLLLAVACLVAYSMIATLGL